MVAIRCRTITDPPKKGRAVPSRAQWIVIGRTAERLERPVLALLSAMIVGVPFAFAPSDAFRC